MFKSSGGNHTTHHIEPQPKVARKVIASLLSQEKFSVPECATREKEGMKVIKADLSKVTGSRGPACCQIVRRPRG